MSAAVWGEFGVEGRRERVGLADEDRPAADASQHRHIRSRPLQSRRADEDRAQPFQRVFMARSCVGSAYLQRQLGEGLWQGRNGNLVR